MFKIGDTVGIREALSLAYQDIHTTYYVNESFMNDTIMVTRIESGIRVNEKSSFLYEGKLFYTRRGLLTERCG